MHHFYRHVIPSLMRRCRGFFFTLERSSGVQQKRRRKMQMMNGEMLKSPASPQPDDGRSPSRLQPKWESERDRRPAIRHHRSSWRVRGSKSIVPRAGTTSLGGVARETSASLEPLELILSTSAADARGAVLSSGRCRLHIFLSQSKSN